MTLATKAIKEVSLEKGMYKTKQSFSEELEALDPSDEYKGTEHEGLDAFQRQLKRFDIVAKGPNSSPVEKFFQTTDSSVLFPEYVSRTVREGLVQANILPQIIATTTQIDADSYRSIYMSDDPEKTKLYRVGEAGRFPVTTIKSQEKDVNIYKFGRQLEMSYEAVRRKRVDLVSVFFKQIGLRIAFDQLAEAVNVIINGDGNNNAAEVFTLGTDPISGEVGHPTYRQILEFWTKFKPYKMNTILAPAIPMVEILDMPEFKNPLSGFNFQATGELVSPLGANMLPADSVEFNGIIGMDKGFCLEQVVEQTVTTESDKLIDKQMERTVISQVSGFAKLFAESAKVLKFE